MVLGLAACDVQSTTVVNIGGTPYQYGYPVSYVPVGGVYYGYPYAGDCAWSNCAVGVIPVYDMRGYIVSYTFTDGRPIPQGYFREFRFHQEGRYSYSTGVVVVSPLVVNNPRGAIDTSNRLTGPLTTGNALHTGDGIRTNGPYGAFQFGNALNTGGPGGAFNGTGNPGGALTPGNALNPGGPGTAVRTGNALNPGGTGGAFNGTGNPNGALTPGNALNSGGPGGAFANTNRPGGALAPGNALNPGPPGSGVSPGAPTSGVRPNGGVNPGGPQTFRSGGKAPPVPAAKPAPATSSSGRSGSGNHK